MKYQRIKYVCYYSLNGSDDPRDCVEAATTKIDYIVSALNRMGCSVDIISPAILKRNGLSFSKGGRTVVGENTVRLFPSFGMYNIRLFRRVGQRITNCFFRKWIKKNIKGDDTLIVYHSLGYCRFFERLRKSIPFSLIGEVEEVYQDVHRQKASLLKAEYDFFGICDKFIFPNTILNSKVNQKGKPFLVVHGLYSVSPQVSDRYVDGKIHVLYSGTFDPVKGGALAAIDSIKYLTDDYHIHITGFGNPNDVRNIENRIALVLPEFGHRLTYHGYISREELTILMQRCHIGLCTQDPTKELNLTSFPSKILNYLSNGLVVLSGRNKAIEDSAVGDIVYYYENQTPEMIAHAIMDIPLLSSDTGRSRLRELDESFVANFNNLLDDNLDV